MKLDTTLGADLPVLTSARLVLRPLQTSDEGLLELYTSDARVAEGTRSIPHPPAAGRNRPIHRTRDCAHARGRCLGHGWRGA